MFCTGAHEWGRIRAAAQRGMDLYLPFVVPAGFGFLGSFGSITRIRGFASSREALLEVASAGPLLGSGVAAVVTTLGKRGFPNIASLAFP
jgi:hypothetical protein